MRRREGVWAVVEEARMRRAERGVVEVYEDEALGVVGMVEERGA